MRSQIWRDVCHLWPSDRPRISIYEQAVYVATRAIVAGQLREGDPFPSVRTLSRELHINPNTAHKVIAKLIDDELLETRAGIGTVVAPLRAATTERTELLNRHIEELVVEATRLSIEFDEVTSVISRRWKRLSIPLQEVSI